MATFGTTDNECADYPIVADTPARVTDVDTEDPATGIGQGQGPESNVGKISDGSKAQEATGQGSGIAAVVALNGGGVRNVSGPNHVAGPAGTWNFAGSGSPALDTHSPSKAG